METAAVGDVKCERKVGLVTKVGAEEMGGFVSSLTGERSSEMAEISLRANGRSDSDGVCCMARRSAVPVLWR